MIAPPLVIKVIYLFSFLVAKFQDRREQNGAVGHRGTLETRLPLHVPIQKLGVVLFRGHAGVEIRSFDQGLVGLMGLFLAIEVRNQVGLVVLLRPTVAVELTG